VPHFGSIKTQKAGKLETCPTETIVMTFSPLIDQILAFRDERDWAQFHTPKHLANALGIEVAELQELMLWKNDQEVADLIASKTGHGKLSDEIADILIYSLLFCESAGIDPEVAIRIKLKKNAEKYPVEESKGNATKYTDLP
jgi:NTP pyrophosphatase (non-canonical NTP hydrolase)